MRGSAGERGEEGRGGREGGLTWRTSERSSSRGMPREVKSAFGRRDVVRPSIEARVSVRGTERECAEDRRARVGGWSE